MNNWLFCIISDKKKALNENGMISPVKRKLNSLFNVSLFPSSPLSKELRAIYLGMYFSTPPLYPYNNPVQVVKLRDDDGPGSSIELYRVNGDLT